MAKSWTMAGRGIALKIRNPTQLSTLRLGELVAEAYVDCPNCQYCIDNSHVTLEWPELPAGVKFDPSELELLQHLEGKSGLPNSKSHVLIDEFIPTIEEVEGICYTHPKNLPAIRMDGSCRHFFHRISNAYGCGQRKRRRIRKDGHTVCDEHIRWHKTGKSKPVFDDNGALKGWKKILVLYTGSMRGGSKSSKSGWVMHQYHLGADEDEMDGELVVSKIFYQPKQIDKFEMDASALDYDASHKPEPDASVLEYDASDKSQMNVSVLEPDPCAVKIDPRTPKADPPPPHRPSKSPCETEQYTPILLDQGEEDESGTSIYRVKDEAAECPALSQVVMDAYLPVLDESMQPKEAPPETPQQALDDFNLDEFLGLPGLDSTLSYLGTHSALNTETPPQPLDCSNMDAFDGLPNLENTLSYLGAPSALSTLADLHFGSQDSLGGWPDNFSTEF